MRRNPLRIFLAAVVRVLIPGKVGEYNDSPNKTDFSKMQSHASCHLVLSKMGKKRGVDVDRGISREPVAEDDKGMKVCR